MTNKLYAFALILGAIAIVSNGQKMAAEDKVERNLNAEAKVIQQQQINDANVKAEQLIANATGEQKACLQLPGVSSMSETYKKAEACNLGKFAIEGTYFIKQRISG